jgi:thiol-disulfide isomerase/thioredoxin
MKSSVLSVVCMTAVAALCSSGCDNRTPARIKQPVVKQAAQPATVTLPPIAADGLRDVDGPGLVAEIRAAKRKATLLNVWASWCGSCKRELPMLVSLGQALESEGVAVMFVSVDEPKARPAAVALLETLQPKPSSFIVKGSLGPFMRAVNPRWKGALPATLLYDENAELLWFWPGPVLEHEITPIVSQHLAGQPLEGPTLVEPDPPPR